MPTGRGAGELRRRHRARRAAAARQPGVPVPRRRPSPPQAPAPRYRISDLELASRLSFFLWSSIPDDELLDAGGEGPARRRRRCSSGRCRRMLADPRSEALAANFAGQWLQLRNLHDGRRRPKCSFPDFDETLRQGFRRETELFFDSILRENRSVLDLLTADYTFLNERLARHYGIPNVQGSHFRRVTLRRREPPRPARSGQHPDGDVAADPDLAGRSAASGFSTTSSARRRPTAARRAGAARADRRHAGRTPSMRERMAQHRANPVCASCHAMIDPLGFALENFDADRPLARRRRDRSSKIDASAASARRHEVRRRRRAARGAREASRALRRARHREAADLRARPRPRVLRHAGGARRSCSDAADAADYQLSTIILRHRPRVCRSRSTETREIMIITKMALPRRTFLRGMGAASRCRCWMPWCRRCRRCRTRPPGRCRGWVLLRAERHVPAELPPDGRRHGTSS